MKSQHNPILLELLKLNDLSKAYLDLDNEKNEVLKELEAEAESVRAEINYLKSTLPEMPLFLIDDRYKKLINYKAQWQKISIEILRLIDTFIETPFYINSENQAILNRIENERFQEDFNFNNEDVIELFNNIFVHRYDDNFEKLINELVSVWRNSLKQECLSLFEDEYSSHNKAGVKILNSVFKHKYTSFYNSRLQLKNILVNEVKNGTALMVIDEQIKAWESSIEEDKRKFEKEQEVLNSKINEVNNDINIDSNKLLDIENNKNKIVMEIEKIKNDIEAKFIALVPRRRIFDISFIEYAIECIFYGRAKTIGEILNLYENYEFNSKDEIRVGDIINSLKDIQLMQFHNFMQLKETTDGIRSISHGIHDLEAAVEYQNFELIDSIENMKNEQLKGVEALNETYCQTIARINKQSSLAHDELEKLSSIDNSSRQIAKELHEAKDFMEKVKFEKHLEGKLYY